MALDAYLQIEGIKGESTDSAHKDWIEIFNVAWSIHQPRATSASTAGGLTTGRAELSNLAFSKLADLSSPILQQHCAMGKTIPKAKFEFMRADGDGKPICYYFAYSKMKWAYTKQGVRGGSEGKTAGGWDCAANKCV